MTYIYWLKFRDGTGGAVAEASNLTEACPSHVRLIEDVAYLLRHMKPVKIERPADGLVVPRGNLPGRGPGKAA